MYSKLNKCVHNKDSSDHLRPLEGGGGGGRGRWGGGEMEEGGGGYVQVLGYR